MLPTKTIVTLVGMMAVVGSQLASVAQEKKATNPFFAVTDYGAVGNGITKNTQAIQKAIDTAAAEGGGTVYFPAGNYLSGTIYLKNNITLHLDAGATLLGSNKLEDFPITKCAYRSYTDNYTYRSLIFGENLHNIAIVGRGTIDGQGAAFKFTRENPYLCRPYIIRIITCKKVLIEGIRLQNSPMWMQHYLACDNVTVRGITVYNHVNANNDMIDIDCCHNVRISDCYAETDDDAITLKSTSDRPCENVTITNCTVSSLCNAIKMGTETNGGFKNITISNCTIFNTGIAGLALEIVDGGTMDRVAVSNITMNKVKSAIFLRLGNRARPFKKDMPKPKMGKMQNIIISNIVATGASHICCPIVGLPGHPIKNVTISNVNITCAGGGTKKEAARIVPELPEKYPECKMFGNLPAYGFYCRHVDGLTLSNINVKCEIPDERPLLVCDDVKNLEVIGLKGQPKTTGAPTILLDDVAGAMIRGCIAPAGTDVFVRMRKNTQRVSLIGNDLSRAQTAFDFKQGTPESVMYQANNRRGYK